MINITINGEKRQIKPAKISELVVNLELDARKIAIERNLEIVPRSKYDETWVADGDNIEIVAFIGGG
jgi:thiamine biosynthesis protein ThiS